jgi:hypothetical protein
MHWVDVSFLRYWEAGNRERGKRHEQVWKRSMARITQQRNPPVRMTPISHLLAILQAPLARLLNNTQQRFKSRIPIREEVAHLLDVRFGRIHQFGEVVGTHEHDVVHVPAFEQVADGVPVGSEPVVDLRVLDELEQICVLAHIVRFHNDAVCKIASKTWGIHMAEERFAARGFQPVGAEDEVILEFLAVAEHH